MDIIKFLKKILNKDILGITPIGGMTNSNFLVSSKNEKYVVRLPKKLTSIMINREYEKFNSSVMSQNGYNVETLYFNHKTGIKITRYLEKSIVLNHTDIQKNKNLELIAKRLYNLHTSNIKLANVFDIKLEFNKYLSLLKDKSNFYKFNDTIDKIVCFFYKVIDCLDYKYKKLPLVPCHNDLVPENILISDNKTYFIDWEYSGMNYPLFDISALFLESNLDYFQQKDFLR
ncbi:choline/ethanolamine kinase family protein, partial [Rodentibacter caecimuris]